jgi:hypothetical protein
MTAKSPHDYKTAIETSGKDIYSEIRVGDDLWIPTPDLEFLLNEGLRSLDLNGLALRTRSKVVKEATCRALGYPVPRSFKKVQPRFTGQQLDTYTQKSSNLQIWNEELSPTRRYAIIQISSEDKIQRVKVVSGQELVRLDTTGTITKKFQARLDIGSESIELISEADTPSVAPHVRANLRISPSISPAENPRAGFLMPITEIAERLAPLIGQSFQDPGTDQERNRGAALHKLVCEALGYSRYEDNGQFPDVRHQLLEVKLQTSPTVDLGLVLPSSNDPLDIGPSGEPQFSHRDTRYVLFYAKTNGTTVLLTNMFVTTGADFFNRLKRFEGKVQNGKIQIPLPESFFDR